MGSANVQFSEWYLATLVLLNLHWGSYNKICVTRGRNEGYDAEDNVLQCNMRSDQFNVGSIPRDFTHGLRVSRKSKQVQPLNFVLRDICNGRHRAYYGWMINETVEMVWPTQWESIFSGRQLFFAHTNENLPRSENSGIDRHQAQGVHKFHQCLILGTFTRIITSSSQCSSETVRKAKKTKRSPVAR